MNKNQAHLCDATEGIKNIKEAVNVYVIDPPYGIGKNFGNNFDNFPSIEEYVAWCRVWLDEAYKSLVDDGTIYIFGDAHISQYLYVSIPYPKRTLIWSYTNKNYGEHGAMFTL